MEKVKLSEIGEFGLIDKLTREIKSGEVVIGIGDDAAVLRDGTGFRLYTTDMMVEGDHFRLGWADPVQIGRKAMDSNISDIAAMGGFPDFALVSMALTENVEVETVEGIYRGMYEVADRYGVEIIGGDTTHGNNMVLNLVVMGRTDDENLCTRSGAKAGDLVLVTGPLGGSKAGLELLLRGYKEPAAPVRKHLDPGCRMDISRSISPFASAMIDVSDGLASEVGHICRRSGVGAVVERALIPLHEGCVEAAEKVEGDPYAFALSGGEDFELVFTVPRKDLDRVRGYGVVVGRITHKKEGMWLKGPDRRTPLGGGFDHFSQVKGKEKDV